MPKLSFGRADQSERERLNARFFGCATVGRIGDRVSGGVGIEARWKLHEAAQGPRRTVSRCVRDTWAMYPLADFVERRSAERAASRCGPCDRMGAASGNRWSLGPTRRSVSDRCPPKTSSSGAAPQHSWSRWRAGADCIADISQWNAVRSMPADERRSAGRAA